MTYYNVNPLSLSDKEAFVEASVEELRVLLALIESQGAVKSVDELAKRAKTSKTRASSALVFWQEACVIAKGSSSPTITEEFEERLGIDKIYAERSAEVAKTIRNESLAGMIEECARIMKRTSLNTEEIKNLTALYEQYGLGEEYIVTLTAHLAEASKTKVTVAKIVNKATKLFEKEIDTVEELDRYFEERKSTSEAEHAFRSLFNLYNRALSKTEKAIFKKWGNEYGYYTEIVEEAYDIAVNSRKRWENSTSYVTRVDEILTRWYETGCRTVAECRARYEEDERAEKETKKQKKPKDKKKNTERFGDFDVNDAFMKALDRSYGQDDKK